MKSWTTYLMEKQGDFKYSCLMAKFPLHITNKIKTWQKTFIKKDDLYTKEADNGLETEIHVTVLYGLHDSKPDKIIELLKNTSSIKLTLGKTSIFEQPEYDVVKFSVESPDLVKLNQLLRKKCEYTSNHPRYSPHCTIAYVKKGCGKNYIDNTKFQGTVINTKNLVFSSKDGEKTNVPL